MKVVNKQETDAIPAPEIKGEVEDSWCIVTETYTLIKDFMLFSVVP
jgi:hypothetical protein